MNSTLKRIFPLILAITLLAFALKDVSYKLLFKQFNMANYSWVSIVIALTLLVYLIRGKRWQQALLGLNYKVSTFRATTAMLSGMVASMVVPGSGELTRCATIQRTNNVPLSHGIGSVVAERVLDFLMLLVLLFLAFVFEFNRMLLYISSVTLVRPGWIGIVLLIIVLIMGGGLYWGWSSPAVRKHPVAQKFVDFAKGLQVGFWSIRKLPNPSLFISLTLLSQLVLLITTYCSFLAMEITQDLPVGATLTILAVASIGGIAVPTQSGIGTYHFFVSRALTLYGLTPEEGVIAATFMHAIGFAINLILSSISFVVISFLVSRAQKTPDLISEK